MTYRQVATATQDSRSISKVSSYDSHDADDCFPPLLIPCGRLQLDANAG